MSKYLELVEDSFNESHFNKQKNQNPYVAYSIKDDQVIYTIVPKEEGLYKMVDLGLPSGLKWADRNVGASSPEDAGLYFQWGDTVGYTADQVGVDKVFNWKSYFDTVDRGRTFNIYNNNGGLTVLESSADAATVHMGSDYRMPTMDEIWDLLYYTTQTFIDVDGNEFSKEQAENGAIEEGNLKGVKFTGSNGNSIFIPAAGYCWDDSLYEVGAVSELWSSNLDWSEDGYAGYLFVYYNEVAGYYSYRYFGLLFVEYKHNIHIKYTKRKGAFSSFFYET